MERIINEGEVILKPDNQHVENELILYKDNILYKNSRMFRFRAQDIVDSNGNIFLKFVNNSKLYITSDNILMWNVNICSNWRETRDFYVVFEFYIRNAANYILRVKSNLICSRPFFEWYFIEELPINAYEQFYTVGIGFEGSIRKC